MNALNELDIDLRDSEIKCAIIRHGRVGELKLSVGHSKEELALFRQELDFDYDNGNGGQELFGTVWLKDEGRWLERGEYYGSEWWDSKQCPTIPKELL